MVYKNKELNTIEKKFFLITGKLKFLCCKPKTRSDYMDTQKSRLVPSLKKQLKKNQSIYGTELFVIKLFSNFFWSNSEDFTNLLYESELHCGSKH